jgi:hypothetical protein
MLLAVSQQALYEHILLKFVSFLSSQLHNPLLAFYELKTQIYKYHKDHSLYFSWMSTVYSKVPKSLTIVSA